MIQGIHENCSQCVATKDAPSNDDLDFLAAQLPQMT